MVLQVIQGTTAPFPSPVQQTDKEYRVHLFVSDRRLWTVSHWRLKSGLQWLRGGAVSQRIPGSHLYHCYKLTRLALGMSSIFQPRNTGLIILTYFIGSLWEFLRSLLGSGLNIQQCAHCGQCCILLGVQNWQCLGMDSQKLHASLLL